MDAVISYLPISTQEKFQNYASSGVRVVCLSEKVEPLEFPNHVSNPASANRKAIDLSRLLTM